MNITSLDGVRPENIVRLNKFKPRPFQIPLIDALENKGYKRLIAVWPRRAGKDITAWNLAIRQCLRRVCTVFYVFPTYAQGKKVLWDSVTNTGERILDHYVPQELVESKNSQEMKIRFKNGSLIQIVGSDNIDSLVGTNPYGVIFSEYALQLPDAFNFLRPILAANDGWAMFISCVTPDTLVITEHGLRRIKDVSCSRDEYSDLNKPIYGLGGFHNAEQFYYGGKQSTLKITLESGYTLECTPIHPIWNGTEWIKSKDLNVGDLVPIQYGQDVWDNGLDLSDFDYHKHGHSKDLDLKGYDFFYLLGLIHADGNYDVNKVCVTKKKDPEIIDFLHTYGFKTRLDGIHHELNSKELCSLLEHLGFKHGARNKTFPEMLFSCNKREMIAFIQGIFDGDGCSASNPNKYGYVKLTSTCLEFMQDLQIILLNFGIVSSIRSEFKLPSKLVKVSSLIYNLEITGYFAHIFYRDIGFRLFRKQVNNKFIPRSCLNEPANVYPIDIDRLEGYMLAKNIVTNPKRISRRLISKLNYQNPHPYLEELLAEKLFYSPIKSIVQSESEVFDFVIPETHSFFSNGFISHNTPRGKNHLYTLYQVAINNPETWFVSKLTVEDTQHIPLEVIERERCEGLMSDDLIKQEYYTSFEMGQEGSVYGKYIDRMKINNQIGVVPWEPAFKVHVAIDIGVRDATTMLFFQVIGTTVRIIDCYSNNREGVEHYVSVINSKPYTYGKYIAPHDIRVQEFGSGITRFEKARQLGIIFTLSNDLSIADGIEAVKTTCSKLWIDEKKCKDFLKAFENYRREWDQRRDCYKDQPLHDWSSHYADSLRYLCVSLPKTQDSLTAKDLDKRFQTASYGQDNSMMPSVFRDDIGNY